MQPQQISKTVFDLPISIKERLARHVANLNAEKESDKPKITMVGYTTELLNRHLPQEETLASEAQGRQE